MPWYYAGSDAKPVGPIALEELQARRQSGVVSSETYVIEFVGQPGDPRSWKRYKELFPATPSLPALPPPPPALPPPPPPQPHPLFPSAGPHAFNDHGLALRKTNSWCTWGFGLGLASLILILPSCGLTVLIALPALVVSIVGLVKVQHNRLQGGRNLALSGLFLSGATLLLAVIFWAVTIPLVLKGHSMITATEQSTTDSE